MATASRHGSSTAAEGFSDERLEGEGDGGAEGAAASEEETAASWWWRCFIVVVID